MFSPPPGCLLCPGICLCLHFKRCLPPGERDGDAEKATSQAGKTEDQKRCTRFHRAGPGGEEARGAGAQEGARASRGGRGGGGAWAGRKPGVGGAEAGRGRGGSRVWARRRPGRAGQRRRSAPMSSGGPSLEAPTRTNVDLHESFS